MKVAVLALMALGIVFPRVLTSDEAQPLTLQQLLKQMGEQDRARTAILAHYTCTRRYALDNHRFHVKAELSVRMTYNYPGHKEFQVVAEHGSSIIRQRVLRRMLEAEEEASRDDVRESTRITPRNYDFQLLGIQVQQGRPAYVLEARPKAINKFSLRGKIWVDRQDFAIVRVEAAPALNPSALIRDTRVVQQNAKFGRFWLPVSNRSETGSFVFGRTRVTIDSWDYEITQNGSGSNSGGSSRSDRRAEPRPRGSATTLPGSRTLLTLPGGRGSVRLSRDVESLEPYPARHVPIIFPMIAVHFCRCPFMRLRNCRSPIERLMDATRGGSWAS